MSEGAVEVGDDDQQVANDQSNSGLGIESTNEQASNAI